MRWLTAIILGVLVAFAHVRTANAELLYEAVSGIQVPTNITLGVQAKWQGHIIYEVKDLGQTYQIKISRDSEPHSYPYFYVSYSKNWDYMGTTNYVDPEAERKAAEDAAKKAQEDQAKQQEEQERQRREQEDKDKPKPPRQDPPIVKPPEEEPEPEEPEPDDPEEPEIPEE